MGIAPSPPQSVFVGLLPDFARLAVRVRDLPGFWGSALLSERERWALWLPVALGAGIGTYFALPIEPQRTLVLALVCWAMGLVIASLALEHAVVRACCIVVATGFLGFGVAKLRTEMVAAPVLMHRLGPVELDARVESA